MPSLLSVYARVSETLPCPKCGRSKYCLIRGDGKTVICSVVKSGKERKSKAGDTIGWLHYLPPGEVKPIDIKQRTVEYLTPKQIAAYLVRNTSDTSHDVIASHAQRLGLSPASLKSMRVRYGIDFAALVFPMFDGARSLTGCRFRRQDGSKWSLRGGREGVFLSRNFNPAKLVWISEGPTDGAALCHSLLDNVIGRPNCSGGKATIASLLHGHEETPVVIVSDPNDVGVEGSATLAEYLPNPTVVIKASTDLRDFVCRRLPRACRQAIVKGVGEVDGNPWQPIHKNLRGLRFDFTKVLQA